MKVLFFLLSFCSCILFAYSSPFAAHLHKEKEYQNVWCNSAGGITEYVLDDGTRVDCLTDAYAIEFDFAPKWAESVGQALYYGLKTGRKPGVVLIMEKDGDDRYLKRLKALAEHNKFMTWIMKASDLVTAKSHAKIVEK